MIASRKGDACVQAAAEIQAASGRDCLGVACHVGRWQDCDQLVAAAYERFGRVDVLVNNAGMSPLYGALSEVSEDLYDKVFAVNLRGAFRLASLIGTRMAAGDGGSIINVSSIAAVQPTPHELPYAMAKAGLNAMTIGLARAFGPKVRVNCIMPGPFMTDITGVGPRGVRAHGAHGVRCSAAASRMRWSAPRSLRQRRVELHHGAVLKIDGGLAFAPA